MKAGFLVPGNDHNVNDFRNQPLGSLLLLSVLEERFGSDLELELVDLRGLKTSEKAYRVPEKDIYFYSVTSPESESIAQLVKRLRRVYPHAVHIAGGPHVEIFPEECEQFFDAISLGEGEENIQQIVTDVGGGNLKTRYQEERRLDVNNYPFPKRGFLPKLAAADTGVVGSHWKELVGTTVMFSRGCPFNCSFCANILKGKINFRTPDRIIEEIEYLKRDYGVEGIVLRDDQAIPTNRAIAEPALEAIARTNVKWRGQSRANGVSTDMLKLAKRAGCVEIGVGVETVSQRSLDALRKQINLEGALKYLQEIRKQGISSRLLLMMGVPGEPDDVAERTIEFIRTTQPSSVMLSYFTPLPGCDIYAHPEEYGMRKDPAVLFQDYHTSFGRFDPDEKPKVIFSFEKDGPYGRGKTKEELIANYMKVQAFVRENGLNF